MFKQKLLTFTCRLSALLFWPGLALVVWGELTPHPPQLAGPWRWDKLDHFTAYFGLAAMATLVLKTRRRLAVAIVGLILLGGALEIVQGYTGRDPDIMDAITNSIGALAGCAMGIGFLRLLQTPALVGNTRAD